MIGLMDCNNFFVSCERLFRPDLAKKPVAVLSSNDGCVVSRSQEVKDIGVPMGMPYFQIKDMYKNVDITLFSSNFALYRDISSRVMHALKDEFSTCEIYSIDESFFEIGDDFTEEMLLEVRARIMQKTGIPVSIGVAQTKTLAKVASKLAKSGNGVKILHATEWQEVTKTLPCGSIWGIGRQLSATLSKENVYTVAEFLSLDKAYIAKRLGVVGERLHMELNGILVNRIGDNSPREQESYTSTRSFGSVVHDKHVLLSSLSYHVAHVAEKLRMHKHLAKRLSIIVRASRFSTFSHKDGSVSIELLHPTNDTFTLIKEVSRLLDSVYDPEIPYKKAGVVVSGVVPEGSVSGSLFGDQEKQENHAELNTTTDAINTRFGRGAIHMGVTFSLHKWKENRKLASKEYTTKWTEIPSVKAI